MKKFVILSFLLFVSIIAFTQDPKEILVKAAEKCKYIDNGYYELTIRKKYMTNVDTIERFYHTYFKKWDNKDPFPSLFHTTNYNKGERGGGVLFTGEEFVTFSRKDSSGTIMNMAQWADDIEKYSHNYELYNPFTSLKGSPLPDSSSYQDSTFRITFLGKEKLGEDLCYHIQTNEAVENEPGSPLQGLDYEAHFWIDQSSLIPVQYDGIFTMVMNMDTMVQYTRNTLTSYELNSNTYKKEISLDAIPAYIQLKDYTPYQQPDPLPLDTIAPQWSFPSLTGETVSLEKLQGKLVLIDFFYKSCFPCMQALPALQSLHEKYSDQGLFVVGLDPYDTEADNMSAFLAKRNVDYTVLYASKEIATTYRVTGYPTIFLVDKSGKIIHIQEGYGVGVEAELEEIIKKNL